jgi:RNA polymerase sigma factor (sigma-70 family)
MPDYRTDTQLVSACLAGDADAWAELVIRYQRLVYAVAMRHGLSREEAEDVFQLVFTILLDKLDTCRDQERLGAWLTTITRREAWRVAQQRSPGLAKREEDDVLEGLAGAEPPPDAAIERLEEQNLVRQALDRLDARCRRLLWHLFYTPEPPSYAELAERLAMPQGSIGPTRARCLARLRSILRSMGFE